VEVHSNHQNYSFGVGVNRYLRSKAFWTLVEENLFTFPNY